MRRDGRALEYASGELRNDQEFMLEAARLDGSAVVEYASDEVRNDREVVLEAVRQDGRARVYARNELHNDRDVGLKAVRQYGSAVSCYGSALGSYSLRYWGGHQKRKPPPIFPIAPDRDLTTVSSDQRPDAAEAGVASDSVKSG